MEMGLILIFWYGILHAFGPDHLTVIADFSIGKNRKKTLLITLLFALGHGMMLFLFAKLLQHYKISETIMDYGDQVSAAVIIGMGIYILSQVMRDRIQLYRHEHEGKEHIHIWFGKTHAHHTGRTQASAFGMAALMGIGGVRGMLVTLGMLESHSIDMVMIVAFILGVTTLFLTFGLLILYINEHLLGTKTNVRRVFAAAGVISIAVGSQILLA